ncbi:MDR family MFS transporter [Streptomyces sp. NPDC001914]|uniref:MDR family MFS transporter n=1 Tax=Streptomyces sp. NPDC001914 TaxID=3364623 RepID=UPI0036CC2FDB
MSTGTSDRSRADEPRFRDALRGLPRRVWVISLGNLILQAGSFLPVFIVLYLTQRGQSGAASGLVLGAAGLGRVLGNVVGGHLTDFIGRRRAILLSVVATAGLTAVVPFLGALPTIIAVVGLIGVVSQVYRPAMAAVLVDAVTSTQQRLAAFGVLRFAQNIGSTLGGVLGGVVATVSYTGLFLIEAGALLLFGVIVAVLLRDAPPQKSASGTAETPAEAAVGYRQMLTDRVLVCFLLMTVFSMFAYTQTAVGLPLHVDEVGLSERDFGLLMGLNGLLVVLLELPITSVVSRFRPEYVLAFANLLVCTGLALTGVATEMVVLAATVMIWTFGEMAYSSIVQAHLASLTPPGMVGRYQGIYGAAYAVGTGAGPVIGGAVYAAAPWALWTLVGVMGLLGAQLSLGLRRPEATAGDATAAETAVGETAAGEAKAVEAKAGEATADEPAS